MIEWEAPPIFSDVQSSGASALLSAAKLNVLTRDLEYLSGVSDGPHTVFTGVELTSFAEQYMTPVIWRGEIRHKYDLLSLAHYWTTPNEVGADTTSVCVIYDGKYITGAEPTTGSIDLGTATNWTYAASQFDISGCSLVSGSWYTVEIKASLDGDNNNSGFHLVALQEASAPTGWIAPPTFTNTSYSAMSACLNTISSDINVLKAAADRPDNVTAGFRFEVPDDNEWRTPRYAEDEDDDEHNFTNCQYGGGVTNPASDTGALTLRYVLQVGGGDKKHVNVRFNYSGSGGDWPTSLPDSSGINLAGSNANGITEGEVAIPAARVSPCEIARIKINVQHVSDENDTTLSLLYLSVHNEEDYGASMLPIWEEGDSIDSASLNKLSTRLNHLWDGGKLKWWRNNGVRKVGSTSVDRTGYRLGLLRKRGQRYLHYISGRSQYSPQIRYPDPSGSVWNSYHLTSGCDVWRTIDVAQLDDLYPGMYYNLDHVAHGQEWNDL